MRDVQATEARKHGKNFSAKFRRRRARTSHGSTETRKTLISEERVFRASVACSSSSPGGPLERFRRDRRRHLVAAVELAERHVVAAALQIRGDAAAAAVDRQDLIRGAVRDEELRMSGGLPLGDEAG